MRASSTTRSRRLGLALFLLLGFVGLNGASPSAPPIGIQAVGSGSVTASSPAHALAGRSSDRPVLSARHQFDRVLSRRAQTPGLGTVSSTLLVSMVVLGLAVAVLQSIRVADRYAILSRGPPRSMHLI